MAEQPRSERRTQNRVVGLFTDREVRVTKSRSSTCSWSTCRTSSYARVVPAFTGTSGRRSPSWS